MGLGDWFSTFFTNIQVQDGGTISSRHKAITRRLNTDFWNTASDTSHSLYVGSYGRNTAIRGFSDLDMVFELPSGLYFQYDNYSAMDNPRYFNPYATRCRRPIQLRVLEPMDRSL